MGVNFREELDKAVATTYWEGEGEYNTKKEICNARFDLCPAVLAYCESATEVSDCIKIATKYGVDIRVRSGGHQHEGMCSANGVLVIDLSSMNQILDINEEKQEATIQAGKKLIEVYNELGDAGYVIPAGGCESVRPGGLVQGGGWGPWSRKLGLTCDNLISATLVDAQGDIKTISATEHKDLFWAIRGGGGGNFGVITEYVFTITKLPEHVMPFFSIYFGKDDLEKVLRGYIALMPELENELTTFCRVSIVDEDRPDRSTIMIGGQYFGTEEQAQKSVEKLRALGTPLSHNIEMVAPGEAHLLANGKVPLSVSGRSRSVITPQTFLFQLGNKEAPSSTCNGNPYPHKVSSTFPNPEPKHVYNDMLGVIIDQFQDKEEASTANLYLSIHSMGGAIADKHSDDTAFYFRDRHFILQYQAWWSDKDDPNGKDYVDWVIERRKELADYTSGSFINFVDREIPLSEYYGGNLTRLGRTRYDSHSAKVFDFEMSIPPIPPFDD